MRYRDLTVSLSLSLSHVREETDGDFLLFYGTCMHGVDIWRIFEVGGDKFLPFLCFVLLDGQRSATKPQLVP